MTDDTYDGWSTRETWALVAAALRAENHQLRAERDKYRLALERIERIIQTVPSGMEPTGESFPGVHMSRALRACIDMLNRWLTPERDQSPPSIYDDTEALLDQLARLLTPPEEGERDA